MNNDSALSTLFPETETSVHSRWTVGQELIRKMVYRFSLTFLVVSSLTAFKVSIADHSESVNTNEFICVIHGAKQEFDSILIYFQNLPSLPHSSRAEPFEITFNSLFCNWEKHFNHTLSEIYSSYLSLIRVFTFARKSAHKEPKSAIGQWDVWDWR